jgi:hypothetical protein
MKLFANHLGVVPSRVTGENGFISVLFQNAADVFVSDWDLAVRAVWLHPIEEMRRLLSEGLLTKLYLIPWVKGIHCTIWDKWWFESIEVVDEPIILRPRLLLKNLYSRKNDVVSLVDSV